MKDFIRKILRESVFLQENEYAEQRLDRYMPPNVKKTLFKLWDQEGRPNYNQLKLVGVHPDEDEDSHTDFRNIGDIVYPLLVIEWLGGIENTPLAKSGWQTTNEMGFTKLKYKVEPLRFDYLYDESVNFGDPGYACYDIRITLDKDGDLDLPMTYNNKEDINYYDEGPFIQALFPPQSRDKLMPWSNYNDDQMETIESLWDTTEHSRNEMTGVMQFCRVEIKLV
tara:strand:- start:7939 stop:8610 length:672 start_codon:yes stop_codon:yes gene_type:complete